MVNKWIKSALKFRNKKVVSANGVKFDSKLEYSLFQIIPSIFEVERQVKFSLLDKFTFYEKAIRQIDYIADFVINRNGHRYVIDAKGIKTDVFAMKEKMFIAKYYEPLFVINNKSQMIFIVEKIKEGLSPQNIWLLLVKTKKR